MKSILLFSLFILISLTSFAQDDNITKELKLLHQQEQYDKVISLHAPKAETYTAQAIYYIGLAYYMKEDDSNCIKMMELCLSKDSKNLNAYFIKGKTLQYLNQHQKAIESLDAAIKIDAANGEFYSALGDSYAELNKLDKALEAYLISAKQTEVPDRTFIMIPQIYSSLGDSKKALSAFYEAQNKIPREGSSYITVLYNIGLLESMNGNFDKAESSYKELLTLSPNDFHSYAKLVQIYYAKKEYVKAIPLKEKLYTAHSKGLLKDNLMDMFCFDQFKWNDKLIQVFERYDEPEGKVYYKHIFYVVNQNGDIEYSIQTENSPVSLEQGGSKYLIGMRKGNSHATYNIGFSQNPDYEKLKQTVISILDGKITPTASSQPN